MAQRLLDIFRSSGDANIGQTLLRLAALAEAAHLHQQEAPAATNDVATIAANRTQAVTPHAAPRTGSTPAEANR